MPLNTPQKICTGFLLLLFLFWIGLTFSGSQEGFYNYLYSFLFGLIPLIGGIIAMSRIKLWGGFKTVIGKAIFFIGMGIFCQGFGETIWAYYNFFLKISAPYPSLADIGFSPSVFFYGIGAVYLIKATGATLTLKTKYEKIFAVAVPFIVFCLSYYVLVVVARGGVLISPDGTRLKTILDIVYPIGDFVSLTLSIVMSGLAFRHLKGTYKLSIIAVLAGLAVMFIGDSIFSYTTTTNTFYNGDAGDLVLTLGLFLLTFGVLGFYTPRKNDKGSSEINISGDTIVFTSPTEEFALVIENDELAEALKRNFGMSQQEQRGERQAPLRTSPMLSS